MKRIILAALLGNIISFALYSQSDIGIFGINRTTDPFEYFLGKLDLENGQISNLDTLPSTFGGFGSQYSPTIDPIGNRYFIISSSKLWSIDLDTGTVLDTLDMDGNDLWYMQYNYKESITGVKQITEINSFKIYPNPARNSINIDLTNCDKNFIMVNILSISGNIMESMSLESHKINQFDLSKLESGIYIIELNTSNNKYYKKIFKQ